MISAFQQLFGLSLLSCVATFSIAQASDSPEWTTVWKDEFSGSAINRDNWSPEVSCWGGGNNERQCYTDRSQNIQVKDGFLHLIATPERWTGPTFPDTMLSHVAQSEQTQEYTSGKVRTVGLHAWRYGRVSARMKLPSGQGTWPAFWMMPADDVYGLWPLSGEIDIMEATNLGTPTADCEAGVESRTSGALHFGDAIPDNTYWFSKAECLETGTPADGWRVYSLEWAEGVFQWFVDGQVFMRLTADQWFTSSQVAEGRANAPFDQPFYLMFNYAVGGNLAEQQNGGGFDPASFPSELLIDWVKVEQCEGDQETGRACLTEVDWDGEPSGPWETMAR